MWLGSTDVTSYLTGSRSQCDPLEPRLVIPYDGAAQMKKKKTQDGQDLSEGQVGSVPR